jgi:hypothetical protein
MDAPSVDASTAQQCPRVLEQEQHLERVPCGRWGEVEPGVEGGRSLAGCLRQDGARRPWLAMWRVRRIALCRRQAPRLCPCSLLSMASQPSRRKATKVPWRAAWRGLSVELRRFTSPGGLAGAQIACARSGDDQGRCCRSSARRTLSPGYSGSCLAGGVRLSWWSGTARVSELGSISSSSRSAGRPHRRRTAPAG